MPAISLDALISIALDAGREIMAVRAGGCDTLQKHDGSPVTLADQRAEALIEESLARLAPGMPVLGEEAVSSGRIPEASARYFCVDPLDGTRDFVAGGDQFTVNIALIEAGEPMLGVVFAPATGELYAGEPGRALCGRVDAADEAPRMQPIQTDRARDSQWRIVASERSGRDARTSSFIATLNGTAAHASSSIKFCRLAEGAADLYPRFGDVCEWDAAAGHAVLSAAGGGLMHLDGTPLRYGARDDNFRIHGFVAFASANAADAAMKALKR